MRIEFFRETLKGSVGCTMKSSSFTIGESWKSRMKTTEISKDLSGLDEKLNILEGGDLGKLG